MEQERVIESKFSEKDRRIYYQKIVYSVCDILDRFYNRDPLAESPIVCGCCEEPSDGVQRAVEAALNASGSPAKQQATGQAQNAADTVEKKL